MASRMLSCRLPSVLTRTQLRAAVANGICSRNLSVGHPNPNIQTSQLPGTSGAEEGHAAAAPVTKITQLPNGVRVISESSHGLGCSMAIFLGTGSRFETQETHGSSHFLQHLAFKATKQRSHFMLTRGVEKLGGHVAAGASRDCITFAGECISKNAEGLFELMAESALSPRTESLDLSIAANLVLNDVHGMEDPGNASKNGGAKVLDALHEVSFGGETLGAPLLAHSSVVHSMTGSTIEKFLSTTVTPARIVVSAVGVEHSRLVEMATKAFGELPSNTGAAAFKPAQYGGGEIRIPGASPDVHLAIGFKGVSCSDPDLLASAALQSLLGGGDSFSAGGPGKGLTSRLFVNVLAEKGILSASGFSVSYQDTGLFGIQATSTPESAELMVSKVCAELVKLKKGAISDEEVTRAINMTRSSLLTNLESKGIICEDLGRQVLYYGERHSAAKLNEGLQKLTGKDLSRVAGKILSSPISVAVTGNVGAAPPGQYIAGLLN